MKVVCPQCKAVYSIDILKIGLNGRRFVKCVKCQSRFYIEKREKSHKGNKQPSRITFLQSFFEKRSAGDRRTRTDRRKRIKKEDLPLRTPFKDIIPLYNKEGLPVGYTGPGRREIEDRRIGVERRYS
ncbi:MJ0042-type zinc finger domain-containing protein [Thermodesulfobacteriota bacterium]